MEKLNVVVIDQNILVRRAITNILKNKYSADVHSIKDLKNSEKVIREQNPDIVFLDIENPVDEALRYLKKLKVSFPNINFIVLGSRSKIGGEAVLNALQKGAVDFITKPKHKISQLLCGDHLEKRLLPIINEITKDKVTQKSSLTFPREKEYAADIAFADSPIKLVVIGGSIGGINTLRTMFKQFPADLAVPIVVVQHMPKIYSRLLADELDSLSPIEVNEAEDNITLMPNRAWIAKGGYHCEVQQVGMQSSLKLHRGPRKNGVRPSIDVLFKSAARLYGSEVLGVLVSGYATDGIFGAQAIKKAGGHIMVEDPVSAFADTLPKSIIESGLADESYSMEELGSQIASLISKRKSGAYENQSSVVNSH
ncbi:chemotaxis protein CheB [Fodinibius halophilus]|uniref:protein-glutamate methylesterase n=1 Tax=Fodinibius halophilus TaxID=1736908 RepID=A0A6M1TNF2_9BACT|nr:chemotaxis protein CheB [Fodinibius halophilus]NGP89890.1 chemotaxis protein CheB [Fodinibius halophilus]